MALLKESQIKEQIRLKLEKLKRAEILNSVIVDDFKKGIYDRDYMAYPVAILQPAAIQNETIMNTANFRTYIFDIVVLLKGEDVQDATVVEELRATLMDEFDSDPTLKDESGNPICDGGVLPASSPVEPIPMMGGKSLLQFVLTLECRAVKDLTFI